MSRALTVVQLLPALESGGVERSTLEIAAALVAAGQRSVVISAGGRLVEPLRASGSEHIDLAIGEKSLRTLGRIGALRRALDAIAPDIVHARSRLPAWIARAALRGSRRRPHFVTTVHGLNSPGRYSRVLTSGERVIAVSTTVRDHLLRHYPSLDARRLTVIPRGVDPQAFPHGHRPDHEWQRRFDAEFPALAGGQLMTLPGRGTRLKGHADAINLLADLRSQHIDARLLLLGAAEAGRDHYLAELSQLAQQRGVDRHLEITAPRADVRDVLAHSALVLQLSRKPEAFGRTVVEALSLGRPVLGYAHGGVGELLAAHFPGGLTPLGDPEMLATAAAKLLQRDSPVTPSGRLPTLAAMQAATLALYREVAGD